VNQGFIVLRPIGEAVLCLGRRRFFPRFGWLVVGLGKKVYFWHSTGPSGGIFVGLAISKFAIPVLFLSMGGAMQQSL
jgi:hypothetical protein